MKKLLFWLLLLVLLLSATACDNHSKDSSSAKELTVEQVQTALNVQYNFSFTQSSDSSVYTAQTTSQRGTINAEITTNQEGLVTSVVIVNHDAYHDMLSTKDKFNDFLRRMNKDPRKCTYGELESSHGPFQAALLIQLLTPSDENPNDLIYGIDDAFFGGFQVSGWTIQGVADSKSGDVTVRAFN